MRCTPRNPVPVRRDGCHDMETSQTCAKNAATDRLGKIEGRRQQETRREDHETAATVGSSATSCKAGGCWGSSSDPRLS